MLSVHSSVIGKLWNGDGKHTGANAHGIMCNLADLFDLTRVRMYKARVKFNNGIIHLKNHDGS